VDHILGNLCALSVRCVRTKGSEPWQCEAEILAFPGQWDFAYAERSAMHRQNAKANPMISTGIIDIAFSSAPTTPFEHSLGNAKRKGRALTLRSCKFSLFPVLSRQRSMGLLDCSMERTKRNAPTQCKSERDFDCSTAPITHNIPRLID
jgi:hypothetical protein